MARQYFETCNTTTISLPTSGWAQGTTGYYQKITNSAIKVDDAPEVSIVYPATSSSSYALDDTEKRKLQKAASYIYLLVTGDGFAYIYATQQPGADLTLELKGVSG